MPRLPAGYRNSNSTKAPENRRSLGVACEPNGSRLANLHSQRRVSAECLDRCGGLRCRARSRWLGPQPKYWLPAAANAKLARNQKRALRKKRPKGAGQGYFWIRMSWVQVPSAKAVAQLVRASKWPCSSISSVVHSPQRGERHVKIRAEEAYGP